ncbi:DUF3310 domain-containing protein [Acetobacter sp. P5B1]|uniref:DUF3310 domain-containing protein n=1 Tax=Acetobacter sp. P5B1 TaxID=2762620 RepID=UPI00207B30B0|nr:DUF3310 domain-containing protein [Acetobacter sp. P5B1]
MNTIAPNHYKTESGLQVWDVTRYMSGNMAQAFQYVYRAGRKGNEVEDLRKAVAFLEDWYSHQDVPAMGNLSPGDMLEKEGPLRTLLFASEPWKRVILNQIWHMDFMGDAVDGLEARVHGYHGAMLHLQHRIAELGGVDG